MHKDMVMVEAALSLQLESSARSTHLPNFAQPFP